MDCSTKFRYFQHLAHHIPEGEYSAVIWLHLSGSRSSFKNKDFHQKNM